MMMHASPKQSIQILFNARHLDDEGKGEKWNNRRQRFLQYTTVPDFLKTFITSIEIKMQTGGIFEDDDVSSSGRTAVLMILRRMLNQLPNVTQVKTNYDDLENGYGNRKYEPYRSLLLDKHPNVYLHETENEILIHLKTDKARIGKCTVEPRHKEWRCACVYPTPILGSQFNAGMCDASMIYRGGTVTRFCPWLTAMHERPERVVAMTMTCPVLAFQRTNRDNKLKHSILALMVPMIMNMIGDVSKMPLHPKTGVLTEYKETSRKIENKLGLVIDLTVAEWEALPCPPLFVIHANLVLASLQTMKGFLDSKYAKAVVYQVNKNKRKA
jgi:hypothetical protein